MPNRYIVTAAIATPSSMAAMAMLAMFMMMIVTAGALVVVVIMAAGAFVQGSSIELTADGPIRPPYAVYFQGGLTWCHAKLGILMSLQKMIDAGLVTL